MNDASPTAAATIAALLAGAWRPEPPPLALSADEIARVIPLVARMKIAPLVWRRLRRTGHGGLPGALELHDAYRYATLEADTHHQRLIQIFEILRADGIEPLVFKGWDVARSYAEFGLRRYEDIDVLVRPTDLERTKAVLAAHDLGDALVDLEHAEITEFDVIDVDALFARSRLVHEAAASIRVLAPEDHLRVVCIHGLKHYFSSAVWLCDIAALIEFAGDDFVWDRLFGTVEPQAQWIACAIAAARDILACNVPPAVGARIGRAPAWFVPEILDGWIAALDRKTYPRGVLEEVRERPGRLAAIVFSRWPNRFESALGLNVPFAEADAVRDWRRKLAWLFVRNRFMRAAGVPGARRAQG